MQIHADAVLNADAGAATADDFQVVGTVRTRKDCVQVLGMFVAAGPVTTTAAEAYTGQYRVSNNALSLRTVSSGLPNEGGAPATNIGHRVANPMWIPFRRGSLQNPVGQQDFLIEYANHVPAPTDDVAVMASLVFTAKGQLPQVPFPAEIIEAYNTRPDYIPGSLVYNWDSEAGADLATVAETTITDLAVESDATGIVGLRLSWADDVFGAEEHIGQIRYESSIPNFEPQEWLLPCTGAPLGTAVGVGGWNPRGGVQYPMFFPIKLASDPGEINTITPRPSWSAAVTTSNPTITTDVAWMR